MNKVYFNGIQYSIIFIDENKHIIIHCNTNITNDGDEIYLDGRGYKVIEKLNYSIYIRDIPHNCHDFIIYHVKEI